MTGESEGGAWTKFSFTGASNGKTFITCPTGPENYRRLRINDAGKAGTAKAHNKAPEFQFVITEVKE